MILTFQLEAREICRHHTYSVIVLLNSLQKHKMPSYSNTFRALIKKTTLIDLNFSQDDPASTNMSTFTLLGKTHHKILRLHYTVNNNSKNERPRFLYHRVNYGNMKLELQKQTLKKQIYMDEKANTNKN